MSLDLLPAIAPELEAQFNLRRLRPDFESSLLPQWLARSSAIRQVAAPSLDLRYGTEERERIDFFPSGRADAPLLVFFHGGYWQRGDKSVYSFVAEPFIAHGISVALVNYSLSPAATVEHIVLQAQRAVAWLWRHANELPCSLEGWFVAGHSAGGQIAARMMATHWPRIDALLPARLLRGAMLLSALFDLEPLLRTSINEGLRLDPAEARATSPMRHAPATEAPQLIVIGERETPAFHRQADAYAAAFASASAPMPRFTAQGCDHFEVVQALADPDHALFRRALAFINQESSPCQKT